MGKSDWKCQVKVTKTEHDKTVDFKVECIWDSNGWNYNINYVTGKVYCGSDSYTVFSNGSVNCSSTSTKNLGSHTFTINKDHYTHNIDCKAEITSNSSYVSGTKSSTVSKESYKTKTSYAITYNANNGTGGPGSGTKWYDEKLTLPTTGNPTRTGYTFQGWGTSNTSTTKITEYTTNAKATFYAIWKINTWTIQYDKNAGNDTVTGMPGNQTKTYNQTLTLGAAPTRTGYTFLGWDTSKSASSATYPAKGNYTSNAGATLYAIWKINTWTVSYNANGGSGAPNNQTKTYNQALTLSSTKPTKSNFDFIGWNTSSTATTANYQPGSSYTGNAALTLYAIWKESYVKPSITSFEVHRYNNTTKKNDDAGDCAHVIINWKVYNTNYKNPSLKIEYEDMTASISQWSKSETITGSGNNAYGTDDAIITGIDLNKAYRFRIQITDSKPTTVTSKILSISSAAFPIDVKVNGTGIAFGKVAESNNVADFKFTPRFRKTNNENNLPLWNVNGVDRRIIDIIINDNDIYGDGIAMRSGGLILIGSGESVDLFINNMTASGLSGGSERTYITSDTGISLLTNMQGDDYNTRREFWFDANGYLYIGRNDSGITEGIDQGIVIRNKNVQESINAKADGTFGLWSTKHNKWTLVHYTDGSMRINGNVLYQTDGSLKIETAQAYLRGVTNNNQLNLIRAYNNQTAVGDGNYVTRLYGSSIETDKALTVNGNMKATGTIVAGNDSTTTGYCRMNSNGNLTAGLAIYFDNGSCRSQYIYNKDTVTNAPNMYITSSGWFRRTTNTSTKEHKKEIKAVIDEELNPEKLYDVEIKQFKYKEDYQPDESDARYDKTLIGFIAEEIEEIYPIAADYETNEEGDIKLVNWNERYLIPPMLKLIQDNHKEIEYLKNEIDCLKNKIKGE